MESENMSLEKRLQEEQRRVSDLKRKHDDAEKVLSARKKKREDLEAIERRYLAERNQRLRDKISKLQHEAAQKEANLLELEKQSEDALKAIEEKEDYLHEMAKADGAMVNLDSKTITWLEEPNNLEKKDDQTKNNEEDTEVKHNEEDIEDKDKDREEDTDREENTEVQSNEEDKDTDREEDFVEEDETDEEGDWGWQRVDETDVEEEDKEATDEESIQEFASDEERDVNGNGSKVVQEEETDEERKVEEKKSTCQSEEENGTEESDEDISGLMVGQSFPIWHQYFKNIGVNINSNCLSSERLGCKCPLRECWR